MGFHTTDDDLYRGTVRRCGVARLLSGQSIRFGRYEVRPHPNKGDTRVACLDNGNPVRVMLPFNAVAWLMAKGWV